MFPTFMTKTDRSHLYCKNVQFRTHKDINFSMIIDKTDAPVSNTVLKMAY